MEERVPLGIRYRDKIVSDPTSAEITPMKDERKGRDL
jgi:hypothetical protein